MFIIGIIFVILGIKMLVDLNSPHIVEQLKNMSIISDEINSAVNIIRFFSILLIIGGFGLITTFFK